MSNLKVCRICLSKGIKVYNYNSYHLKQYYEEIMSKKVNDNDLLPNYFCYECAAILNKFHKFKEKCWMGEKTLQQLLWSGSITLSSISQIDRQDKNLQSSIDLIKINKRIRTCIVKSKTEKDECELNFDSDNSLDNKKLGEIKNEMVNEKPQSEEEEKANIDDEISKEQKEEKAVPDLADDRIFSDDDDSWPEDTDDIDKPDIKEEITIEEHVITIAEQTVEQSDKEIVAQIDDEIVLNTNNKDKKRKKTKTNEESFVDKKAKKFEVNKEKKNFLDPKHWLKINLTEEEALEEFKARALDRKYVSAAYQCKDCYKGFSKEDMLNRHIILTHSESLGPDKCRFCSMRFKIKYHLTRHITQHYTKYKCLRCDLMCPLETTALFHNEYHNGVVRKCVHCGEEFRHISTYYTHLRTHRSEHVCTLCGASFVSVSGLAKHKKIKHVNADLELTQGQEQYCQRCDIKFETLKAYEEHFKHSANHVDGLEDLEINPPITSNPKPPCSSAPKPRQNLRTRRRVPTDCRICGKQFAMKAAWRKHHLAEHKRISFVLPNERQICEICGMSLTPGSVASHLNTHTREKLYTCNTCGRQFNSKCGLNKHQLTHSSEKPVACTLCDKRYKEVWSMKLHYRTYHLKEPYPKRNRKKKTDELSKVEYGHGDSDDSDDNMTLDNFYARKY